MSSTNPETRGGGETDHFPTSRWLIDDLLRALGLITMAGRRILEPGSGDGAIVEALLAHGAEAHLIQAVEIESAYAERCAKLCPTLCADFLGLSTERLVGLAGPYDLILMNPPFSHAQAFIEHAVPMLAPGGVCAALVRLAFAISGQKRAGFRRAHPFDLYPLAARPSFSGEWIARLEKSGADMTTALDPLRRYKKSGQPRDLATLFCPHDMPWATQCLKCVSELETIAQVRSRLLGSDSADYAFIVCGDGRGGRFEVLEAA